MFRLRTKKKPEGPESFQLYDLLFGDVPLEHWKPAHDATPETPWTTFDEVRQALSRNDKPKAEQSLRRLLETTGLESRQQLQAWHFLRELAAQPTAGEAKLVLGVVLEVALAEGLDTLAAYRDHRARFIRHSGKVVVWDVRDPQIDALIDHLLRTATDIVGAIDPWTEPRREPPTAGHVRVNLLTPSGLHFGEGPFDALSQDDMGGPIIAAGAELMSALVARAS